MLALLTIYVLNKEILQFLGSKSAVYNHSGFKSRSGYIGAHTIYQIMTKFRSNLDRVVFSPFFNYRFYADILTIINWSKFYPNSIWLQFGCNEDMIEIKFG